MEKDLINVLLLEDNPADARLVREMFVDAAADKLIRSSFDLTNCISLSDALKALQKDSFDVILTDLELPDSRGFETFLKVHAKAPNTPVVVLTGLMDEAIGVKAVQEGAQDYLVKGHVDSHVLIRAIRFAMERSRKGREQREERRGSDTWSPPLDVIGLSPRLKEVMRLIATVAKTSTTSVLIHGETGTGKELIANSIHYSSIRREGPFIKLNCSAIPDTLLETEMFGYEKGAFTDAKQSKLGLFELADGGTIFLDEIGDMDIRLQPKLLQILENRTLRRVGGIRDIQVDVRVVTATNKNLEEMVREKRFREDLYYRLKVMVINMPPLRDRKEDIILIAEHFLKENSRISGGLPKRLSPEAQEILLNYHWPGNIRELKNAIERASIISPVDTIGPEHLPQELTSSAPLPAGAFPSGDLSLEEVERQYIQHVLDRSGGNKTKAAEILGISRLTLREKLKKAGVKED
ncbi:MAG: sigma-54-dependent Fis family transcriptional regulator [Deltaproteobacteria bacterium]|nr:sigma-54-dependent Fis family transcriptional regulator [Deltaproteobacteria bacterium]